MAEALLRQIGEEIVRRFPGSRCAIEHRVGRLFPSDIAVVIAVSAAHREAAFDGCRYAIERLKQDAPIWKREIYSDGEAWIGLGP